MDKIRIEVVSDESLRFIVGVLYKVEFVMGFKVNFKNRFLWWLVLGVNLVRL